MDEGLLPRRCSWAAHCRIPEFVTAGRTIRKHTDGITAPITRAMSHARMGNPRAVAAGNVPVAPNTGRSHSSGLREDCTAVSTGRNGDSDPVEECRGAAPEQCGCLGVIGR